MNSFAKLVVPSLVSAAIVLVAKAQQPNETTPLPAAPVLHHDASIGVRFEHSSQFVPICISAPEGITPETKAAMEAAGVWPPTEIVLAEKRLLEGYNPKAVPSDGPSVIRLRRIPSCEVGDFFANCASNANIPLQRIGKNEAYELPGFPGPYGENAFCWLVKVPGAWWLLSAPRFYDADDNVPASTTPRPTGYDLELRRILETLEIDVPPTL
ncbi:MAG: hypothetical protein IKQ55_11020 [Kiritimatiellae bacterium]|nr:hypothetical protein [Kiritimatiellia bacterium]